LSKLFGYHDLYWAKKPTKLSKQNLSRSMGKKKNRERGQSPKKDNWPNGTTTPAESTLVIKEEVSMRMLARIDINWDTEW